MTSIRKVIRIDASPALVWDALRDVGALHKRLVPGFATDTRMEGNTRVVTFGNGMVAREGSSALTKTSVASHGRLLVASFATTTAQRASPRTTTGRLAFCVDCGPVAG